MARINSTAVAANKRGLANLPSAKRQPGGVPSSSPSNSELVAFTQKIAAVRDAKTTVKPTVPCWRLELVARQILKGFDSDEWRGVEYALASTLPNLHFGNS